METDPLWLDRLPSFADGLSAGTLKVCAGCQHFRSAPKISDLGACEKLKTEAWAFVPFECDDFRLFILADSSELWLARQLGGDELRDRIEGSPDKRERALVMRDFVRKGGLAEKVLGSGEKKRTVSECIAMLYGDTK